MSTSPGEGRINVRRNVAASTSLLTVSGAPKRRANTVRFMNAHATVSGTAVLEGDDGVDYTVQVPFNDYAELEGDFLALGAFTGGTITALVGWVDDGSVDKNP